MLSEYNAGLSLTEGEREEMLSESSSSALQLKVGSAMPSESSSQSQLSEQSCCLSSRTMSAFTVYGHKLGVMYGDLSLSTNTLVYIWAQHCVLWSVRPYVVRGSSKHNSQSHPPNSFLERKEILNRRKKMLISFLLLLKSLPKPLAIGHKW